MTSEVVAGAKVVGIDAQETVLPVEGANGETDRCVDIVTMDGGEDEIAADISKLTLGTVNEPPPKYSGLGVCGLNKGTNIDPPHGVPSHCAAFADTPELLPSGATET